MIIIIPVFLISGCSKGEEKENYIRAGVFSFLKPDASIWNTDTQESTSKYYPKYKENGLTVIPLITFSSAENKGVIVISKVQSEELLSSTLEKSQNTFKNKNRSGANILEDSYTINGLTYKHYLVDTKITFSRIYITNNAKSPTDALIIDFICPPERYKILSPAFQNFILSFK